MSAVSSEEARVQKAIVDCAVEHYELLSHAQIANAAAATLADCARSVATDLTASLQTLHSSSQLLQHAGQSWRQENAKLHGAVLSYQQIVALMDAPRVVEDCVQQKMFHEALLVFEHVLMLCQNMNDVDVFQRLQKEVVGAMKRAVETHVIPLLSGALTVDMAYKTISLLRRLGGSAESLRTLFLRSRAFYIRQLFHETEASMVPYSRILKSVTVYKVHVCEVTLQYQACFPSSNEVHQRELTEELSVWCQEQASLFVQLMRTALQHLHNGAELALVVQQCCSCASTSARAHIDVLGMLSSVLVQKVGSLFTEGMRQARLSYRTAMQTSSWRVPAYCRNNVSLTTSNLMQTSPAVGDTPAAQLAQWLPLAYALNGILSAFNTIRKCLLPGVEAVCVEEVRLLVTEVAEEMLRDVPLLDAMYSTEKTVYVSFVMAFQRLWYPYILHLINLLLGREHLDDLEYSMQGILYRVRELLFTMDIPSASLEACRYDLEVKPPTSSESLTSTAAPSAVLDATSSHRPSPSPPHVSRS